MSGPEVEPPLEHNVLYLCPDCKHEAKWHCKEGCMLPACKCRKELEAIKEAV